MNIGHAVIKVYKRTGISREDIQATLDAFFEIVKDTVCKGEKVHFKDIGVFELRKKKVMPGALAPKNKHTASLRFKPGVISHITNTIKKNKIVPKRLTVKYGWSEAKKPNNRLNKR